jgi:intracellular septation protein A
MQRLRAVLGFVLWEFGPLVVLLALSAAFGLKVAIAGTIAFVVIDAVRRRWRHIPFTRIYLLSSGLAIFFGTIDLLSQTPFMLKYEAVITNIATGIAFVAGSRGDKPMLQEIAEQRGGAFPDRPDVRYFFRLFTLLWAAYFFIKAGVYLWLGAILPLPRALVLRSIIGSVSLGLMIVISITQGRQLFFLCRRLGLLPLVEEVPPA